MKNLFSSIVVFGDGLSDIGRWGRLTNYLYPPADIGFYESRWTNGRVWVEYFTEALHLPMSLANNFAMGGATTGMYNINEPLKSALKLDATTQVLGMLGQVQHYLSMTPKIDSQALFVLWAGGHDIGSYLEYGEPNLIQYPPEENYKQAIDMLVAAGARNIMIGTMPDMGYTPMYFGTHKQSIASELCTKLNHGLEQIVQNYESYDVTIYKFDGAGVFTKIGSDSSAYGIQYLDAYLPFEIINFMNPLEATNLPIPNQQNGLNPDVFMNWWAVSASAKVHKIIGDAAITYIKQAKGIQ